MTDAMLSGKNCPSCGTPLKRIKDAGGVALWCGNGKCGSQQANWGTVKVTEQEAFDELKRRIEDEHQQHEPIRINKTIR